MKLEILVSYTSFDGTQEVEVLKKYDSLKVFNADIVFQHKYASGFKGNLTKHRYYNKYSRVKHIDDLLKTFNYLPRKLKKQVKIKIAKQIKEYKNNF